MDQLQNSVYQAHQELVNFGIGITSEAVKCGYPGKMGGSHTLLAAIKDHYKKMQSLVCKGYADHYYLNLEEPEQIAGFSPNLRLPLAKAPYLSKRIYIA